MSAHRVLIEYMFDDHEIHVYVPPGWPVTVRPPGAEGWQRTATAFLLECCPPEYRSYPVLLRHPQLLARFASEFVAGQLAATQRNLAGLRTNMSQLLPPPTVDAAVAVLHAEQARLVRVQRACNLVEAALRGGAFRSKL